MLYDSVFRGHGNICYINFIDAWFCSVHNIGPINMINVCINFEINRCNIDEFIKHCMFYLTSRDAKMVQNVFFLNVFGDR